MKLLDSVGRQIGVRKEVSKRLKNIANLQHPERRKVDEVETNAASRSGLRKWDARLEEIEKWCGEKCLIRSASTGRVSHPILTVITLHAWSVTPAPNF